MSFLNIMPEPGNDFVLYFYVCRLIREERENPQLLEAPLDAGNACYCCNSGLRVQVMPRLVGQNLEQRQGLAILRRQGLRQPLLRLTEGSRVCLTCSREIHNQINNGTTKVLNVVKSYGQDICFLCEVRPPPNQLVEVTFEAKLKIYVESGKFMNGRARVCRDHLLPNGSIPAAFYDNLVTAYKSVELNPDECMLWVHSLQQTASTSPLHVFDDETKFSDDEFSVFTGITKPNFLHMFDYIRNERFQRNAPHKKDLLCFLVKLRQGLSDEFLKVLFKYNSRQQVTIKY